MIEIEQRFQILNEREMLSGRRTIIIAMIFFLIYHSVNYANLHSTYFHRKESNDDENWFREIEINSIRSIIVIENNRAKPQ